jgi:integrase
VFTHKKSGVLYLEWYAPDANGRQTARTRSLGHTNRNEAKAAAEALAADMRHHGPPAPTAGPLVLGTLFDIFEAAMKAVGRHRAVYGRCRKRFTAFFGAQCAVPGLDEHEVERYVHARQAGTLVVDGKALAPVRARAIEEELTVLRTVLRWATRKRTETGARLLAEMPVLVWNIPSEANPRRPMLSADEFTQMRAKAWEIDPRLWVALVVCHETGRRLNSVRQLRWSDVDLTGHTFTWRPETEKNGIGSTTPMTDAAREALTRYRKHVGGIGDAYLFPGRDRSTPLRRDQFYLWWGQCRAAAELPATKRAGFHTLRRKLASDLATAPLAMVKALGGWKHPHVVVSIYQQPTVDQQRAILDKRQSYAVGE